MSDDRHDYQHPRLRGVGESRALIWQHSSNPQDPAGDGRGLLIPPSSRWTGASDGAQAIMLENPKEQKPDNPSAVPRPAGPRREFPGPVSGAELAAAIGAGLARA